MHFLSQTEAAGTRIIRYTRFKSETTNYLFVCSFGLKQQFQKQEFCFTVMTEKFDEV